MPKNSIVKVVSHFLDTRRNCILANNITLEKREHNYLKPIWGEKQVMIDIIKKMLGIYVPWTDLRLRSKLRSKKSDQSCGVDRNIQYLDVKFFFDQAELWRIKAKKANIECELIYSRLMRATNSLEKRCLFSELVTYRTIRCLTQYLKQQVHNHAACMMQSYLENLSQDDDASFLMSQYPVAYSEKGKAKCFVNKGKKDGSGIAA